MNRTYLGIFSAIVTLSIASSAYAGAVDWAMYNSDVEGSRVNTDEKTLDVFNIGDAEVLWEVNTPRVVSGTPAVVDKVVYVGDWFGNFYALSDSDGSEVWTTTVTGARFSASPLVTGNRVIIGDQLSGNLYGLNRETGAVEWTTLLDPHVVAAIYGSATPIGGNVAIGVASNEEFAAIDPDYPCCSSRGSMVLVDPKDGAILWQTFMVTDAERALGASGSSIWTTPTYDKKLNLIYAATGNNFSQPTNGTSDAMVAFDADTGAIAWVNQRTEDDEWNFRFPFSSEHPDFDFGDSVQIYTLMNGQKVVGAGQKSGFYHTLDAATGAEVFDPVQIESGGVLGGLFSDSAIADGVIYANGIDWPAAGADPDDPFPNGHLFAFSAEEFHDEVWTFQTPFSINISGVAVANGVVYFQSAFDGNLYALDASNGDPLLTLNVGASGSGPSVSRGQIFMGVGDALNAAFGFPEPGKIIAIGLPE